MAERPTKLARLQCLRDRLPYISQSALAAILKAARDEDLPEGNRQDFREARDAVSHTSTPYGPICQVINIPVADGGDPMPIEVQHPIAMLYQSCLLSRPLSALIRRCVEQRPPTLARPWSLVLYADEVTPGNQLGYKNKRKFWAIYWSVLEWGPQALSDEDRRQTKNLMLHGLVNLMLHGLVKSGLDDCMNEVLW